MNAEAWRQIAPADCIGWPDISQLYMSELMRLARERGIAAGQGMTLTADYHQVDGQWFPIVNTISAVTRGH